MRWGYLKRWALTKRMMRSILAGLSYAFPVVLMRSKLPLPDYELSVVTSDENEVLSSASIIGGIVVATLVVTIFLFQGLSRIGLLVAGIFLAFGIGQQIISACLNVVATDVRTFISKWNTVVYSWSRTKSGREWRFIEDHAVRIYISPFIIHILPDYFGLKPSSEVIEEFVRKNKHELDYDKKVGKEESSHLSFSEYAVHYLNDRLEFHDRVYEMKEKTGVIDPILFIAIGTIVWLISSI